MVTKRIGILPTSEVGMPCGLQRFFEFLNLKIKHKGQTYDFVCDRVKVLPVEIARNAKQDWDLFIDRTTHWHQFMRAYVQHAIYDGVYVLNHPTTFTAVNKHASFVMLERLGAKVPKTWMLPQCNYIDPEDYFLKKVEINPYSTPEKKAESVKSWYHYRDVRLPEMFANHNEFFDFDGIPDLVGGFPFYLKPAQDGGGGSAVSRIKNMQDFQEKYRESDDRVMHAQQAIDFDRFVRCMGIGPQIHPMKFQPDEPLHRHYGEAPLPLSPAEKERIIGEVKLVNSIFRWEYNSYEALIKGNDIHPIDFANACPDSAIASLHVHWPWVIKALVRWCVFCTVTDRQFKYDLNQREFLEAGSAKKGEKERFSSVVKLATDYFQEEQFREFAGQHLKHLDEAFVEFYEKGLVDDIMVKEFRQSRFPLEEQNKLIEEYQEKMGKSIRARENLEF